MTVVKVFRAGKTIRRWSPYDSSGILRARPDSATLSGTLLLARKSFLPSAAPPAIWQNTKALCAYDAQRSDNEYSNVAFRCLSGVWGVDLVPRSRNSIVPRDSAFADADDIQFGSAWQTANNDILEAIRPRSEPFDTGSRASTRQT
ncbi:hypothetical protein KM043_008923 [Ampulex compressa]|nr:hypothetical protein KM043_008923 [Ampulex compressa]